MTEKWSFVLFLVFIAFGFLNKRFAFYFLLLFLPFYAFLITAFQHFTGLSQESILGLRLIKEGIVLGFFVFLIWYWFKRREKIRFYISDLFICTYLLVLLITGFAHHSSIKEFFFGLRYDFFFFLYYFIFRLFFGFYPRERFRALNIIFLTAIIVFIFALLQFFVLPKDFLIAFGYLPQALAEYNPDLPIPAFHLLGDSEILRVQSFFAGPNQLSSFCLIIIFLTLPFLFERKNKVLPFLSFILGLGVLVLTFSRSAWIGLILGMILFGFFVLKKSPFVSISIFSAIVAGLTAAICLFRDKLYEIFVRPSSSVWHWTSLKYALAELLGQPFGIGLGKVGPASQWLKKPVISENYYLQIGLESGFIGLILFLASFFVLLSDLSNQKTIQAFAVFSLTIALLVSSFFLHTLADGVLAIYFGIALALGQTKENR